jgi:hypothetical protein
MKSVITYLKRAFAFHLSILLYQWLFNVAMTHQRAALLVMEVGWTAGGHMVFYVYASNLIIRTLKKCPGEMSIDRSLYNLTELYSIYVICSVHWTLAILSNAVFIAHMWLQIHGFSERPYLSVAFDNAPRLLLLATLMELFTLNERLIDRHIYNLYVTPILLWTAVHILDHWPLKTAGPVAPDGYVRFLWTVILNRINAGR